MDVVNPEFMLRWLLATGITLLLIVLFGAVAQKYRNRLGLSGFAAKSNAPRALSLQETLYIDTKTKVLLLQVRQTEVAVLLSPQGATVLHTVPAPTVATPNQEHEHA